MDPGIGRSYWGEEGAIVLMAETIFEQWRKVAGRVASTQHCGRDEGPILYVMHRANEPLIIPHPITLPFYLLMQLRIIFSQ